MIQEEFVMPDNIPDLYDLTAELWTKIAAETDKKLRKEMVAKYNDAAKLCNKMTGRDTLQVITAKTKVLIPAESKTTLEKVGRVVVKTAFVPQGMTGETVKKIRDRTNTKTLTTIADTAKPKGKKKSKAEKQQSTTAAAPKTGSIIQQILALHDQGKSNKEIVEAGFNKSTVNRQVSEYKKRKLDGNKK